MRALHVITAPICNTHGPITGRNYTDQAVIEPVQALQTDPVITCNGGSVTASLDMGADPTTDSATPEIYRETLGTTPGSSSFTPTSAKDIPACTGGNPPECCQPIPPAFLSTRAFIASLAPGDVPDRCPACGDRNVAPLFWPDASLDLYDCSNPACHAIWSHRS